MEIYKNQEYSFEERAADLVSKMTLEEKLNEVSNHAAPIPRLGVKFYNYWSEASHGYIGPFKYRDTTVTSYPVCLAMSQSWDVNKINKVTEAISDECRALHNINGDELHFWCPTINLARDPRNGRSDENFGEDPYLAGKLAASYIRGMQGNDEKYLKTVATPKHFALNSGENNRHRGSSNVDEATLREYYTKVFEYAIREGKAESIMTSYNRVNGVPSSCNDMLLTTLLRQEWGFNGFVVSDCGAVADLYDNPGFNFGPVKLSGHCYAKNLTEASAMTMNAGTDMSCGSEHAKAFYDAMKAGYTTEAVLDRSLIRIFTSRMRLGLFDDEKKISYSSLGKEALCSNDKAALAVDMANDTIVLLKNDKKLLPLNKTKLKSVLVVGPNAIYRELGGYSAGSTTVVDTIVNVMALQGIKDELKDSNITVRYEKGWCTQKEYKKGGIEGIFPGEEINEQMIEGRFGPDADVEMASAALTKAKNYIPEDPDLRGDDNILFDRALKAAKETDCVIIIAGTDDTIASEERDRETLALPYGQDEKIQRLLEINPNTVVVLTTLGAVSGEFFKEAHTILNAHFAGQAQGTAIANVIFGRVNPNAKLTATWYQSEMDIPHINDYGIRKNDNPDFKARTYMYFEKEPLFPFGYGLSYTEFTYSNLKLNKASYDANENIEVSVDVTNTGSMAGAEIVELYVVKITPEGMFDNKPFRQLKAFEKLFLEPGETRSVKLTVPISDITFWSYLKKKMIVENGSYLIEIGKSSADIVCSERIDITGDWQAPLATVYAESSRNLLRIGETARITPSATLADTTHLNMMENKVIYQSSDNSVVTVDENGIVTAKGLGTALVIVSVTWDNITKSYKIPYAVN